MSSAASAEVQLHRLVEIIERLRQPNGCAWDREQTLSSLRPFLIEEAYEVLEEMDRAVASDVWGPLREELGDLLLQIVFQSQIAAEKGHFSIADVCQAIADKLERRHPQVFADAKAEKWAQLKAQERKNKLGDEGSALDGVPAAAPALLQAERLTEKASQVGFDWATLKQVREKLDEEIQELDQAIASGERKEIEHELGDVLFTVVNLSRFLKTPPEDALRSANRRFSRRFRHVEQNLRREGIPWGEATPQQMEQRWEAAKREEGQKSER